MEERKIIDGTFLKSNILVVIFGIIASIFMIFGCVQLEAYNAPYSGYNVCGYGEESPIFFVIAFICGGIAVLTYFIMNKCELSLTDKRVYGKIKFGKRVDLPLNQISSIGQGWFKSLAIATSSGTIKFWLLNNRQEVFTELSKLLSEFQNTNKTETVVKQEIPQSNADELKKYKDLLDGGVITQEEFDQKKKQLLGL